MLSGFGMMLGSIRRVSLSELTKPTLKDGVVYGIKHIKKIYVIYLITMAIGLIATVFLEFYHGKSILFVLLLNATKTFLAIPLLQTATGTMMFGWAYNGVCWFLSCLFCIYLFSPMLIYVLRKQSKSFKYDLFFYLLYLVSIILLAFIFGNIEHISAKSSFKLKFDALIYGSPYIRVFYVSAGMTLAIVFDRLSNVELNLQKNTFSIFEIMILIVSIIYYCFLFLPDSCFFRYAIDVIICSALIMVFSQNQGIVSLFCSKPLMQKLGNMSMYFFLVHYPIRYYLGMIVRHFGGWNITNAIIFIIMELVMTYFISDWLMHHPFFKQSH